MGTRDVAQDMDTVRAAMGDDQLSYLGFSYGTAIGQVYADLFPDRVRSMVLDGVLELGPTGLEQADDQAAGFETALDRFAEHCDAAEGCSLGDDALDAVEEVLALAEAAGRDPGARCRPAGRARARPTSASATPSTPSACGASLDDALAVALDGDGSELVELADGLPRHRRLRDLLRRELHRLRLALRRPRRLPRAAKTTAEASPHFGEALVNDYIRCADLARSAHVRSSRPPRRAPRRSS